MNGPKIELAVFILGWIVLLGCLLVPAFREVHDKDRDEFDAWSFRDFSAERDAHPSSPYLFDPRREGWWPR